MESLLIWGLTFVLIIIIFLTSFIKFRRQQQANIARKQEAQQLGIDQPLAQYPLIDEYRCIGCGSCMAACPEGDVLGIVYGKALVINGLRCVGHGMCEPACPVGAIKVGLGDIKQREDIPLMNKFNETTVPGLYIAGELGGFSLIRNAISQGNMVVENIAGTASRSGDVPEVIIIGAGPAGLSAALTCIQHKLPFQLLDQQQPGGTILQYPRRKLVMTQPVEIPLFGWLNKTEYSKEELLDIWEKIIRQYQIEILTGHKVTGVRKNNGHFEINAGSRQFLSRYVVMAMGRRGTPRKLGVPGEAQSKVMYQLIDAQSYHNADILIVGGGDSAIEAAVGLARQKNNRVIISYRKNQFFRIKKKNEERIQGMINKGRVKPLFNSRVLEIKTKTVILEKEGREMEIPNDYVFIFIGGEPPFKLLKEAGVIFGGREN